jgi:DNA repair protein RadC
MPEIEISVVYKNNIKSSELISIKNSKDIETALRPVFNQFTLNYQEEFILLCLNRANKILAFFRVSKGGLTGTVADPRVILTAALNCGATNLVLSHNHPSGNNKPSKADEELTQKIKQAAALLDINVLDHLIITDENYFSFADEGII